MFSYGALTLCREFTETREETLQFIHSSSAETASLSRFSEWEYDPKSGKAWQGNHHPVCKWMEFTLLLHAGTTQWPLNAQALLWASQYTHGGDSRQGGSVTYDSWTCDFFLKDFLLLTICLCLSVYGEVHRLQMHWKTSDLRGPVITHSCEPPDGLLGTDLWFPVKAVWILLLSHPFSPCDHLLFLFSQ